MSLAPTNEESAWLNEKKPYNRKKVLSQWSASDVISVVRLDTKNQAKVFRRVEYWQAMCLFTMFTNYLVLFKRFYSLDICPFRLVSAISSDCSIHMD